MAVVRYVRDVRFQVLGPLRVTADGKDLPLGGPQQRLVLALLISAEGRTVSTGRLVDGVWGEDLPPTAKKALQGYIHHLRSEVGEPLRTETGGYSLETEGRVDSIEFADLHREASEILEANPQQAAELLREGLELWSGPAYADLRDELVLASEVARLENLRLVAVGDRIDADLALGRHEALVGELEGLTLEHPLQERFWAQHMLALYRSGRQTEALRSYKRLRRFLADESGLEPSAELRELEERILSQDESLLIAGVDAAEDPAAIRGYELREKVAADDVSETYRAYQRSIGRQVAIRVIGPRLANDPRFISNFLPDTQEIASVEHPHISYVFDTWREPGHAYQVSRWLGGGSLCEIDLAGESKMRVLSDIGDALAHCHRQGIVHGAVEASNVIFDESGHAYLAGFRVGVRSSGDGIGKDIADFAALAHEVIVGRPPRIIDGHRVPDLDRTETGWETLFQTGFSPDGYGRIDDFLRALRQASGADVVATRTEPSPYIEVRNPYKGLKAFQESDADDFYGRDELIDRLEETIEKRRLVAVVGPSGSGKSSVVKAGLLTRLRSEPGARVFAEMYPGAFPFEELEGALSRVGIDRTSLIEDLLSDDRGLLRILKRILPSDDTELILVIDQFEELFSAVEDEGTRQLFMNSLVNAVSEPHSRMRLVVTMRADFFDHPLEQPRFGELLEAGLITVTLPSDDQLAQAAVMPARSEGVEFEDGLVAQIVRDVSGQPGGLPLLQYALTELFDSRDSNTVTLAAYQQTGGVLGALGRRAEALYQGLTPSEQQAIREAFLRMVTVDENADDLRRRVRRSDLAKTGRQRDVDKALQSYAASRLVTFDRDPVTRGPTVEVAHEALLREWPRLRDWVDAQRDDLVIRRRLDAALEEWEQSGEDDGYLPTGSRLAQFQHWAGETSLSLSGPERTFLQAGVEREAERKARATRRRRYIMAGFGIAALAASIFGVFALQNANEAQRNAEQARANAEEARLHAEAAEANAETAEANAAVAETGRLVSDAVLLAEPNRRLGLLLAAEAYERDPGPATLGALQRVMIRNPGFIGYLAAGQSYIDVRWIDDTRVAALASDHLDVYELESEQLVLRTQVDVGPYLAEADDLPEFEISGEADLAVVETTGQAVALIDLGSGDTTELTHENSITALALSRDGSTLAIGDDRNLMTLVHTASGDEVMTVAAHPERSYADDPELAAAGFPEMIAKTDWLRADEEAAHAEISAIAFDHSGDRVASSGGVVVRIWETSTGEQLGDDLKLYPPNPDPTVLGTTQGPNGFPSMVPRKLIFADDALVAVSVWDTARWIPEESVWPLVRRNPTGQSATLFDFAGLEPVSHSEFVYGFDSDGRMVRFDYENATVLDEIDTQMAGITNISIDPSRGRVAAAGPDGLALFSLTEEQLLADSLARGDNSFILTNIDGSIVVSTEVFDATSDPMIWDLSGAEPRQVDLVDEGPWFTDPALHPDSNVIVQLNGSDLPDTQRGVFYDRSGQPTGQVIEDFEGYMAFHPDGIRVANDEITWFDTFDALRIHDLETGELIKRFEFPKTLDGPGGGVLGFYEYSPDGTRLTVPVGNVAHVYDTETWTEIEELAIDDVLSINYGPKDTYLGVIGTDGSIRLLDIETHELIRRFPPNESLITEGLTLKGPYFSSDGSTMFTTDNLTLYDTTTGTPIGDPLLNEFTGSAVDEDELRVVTGFGDSILIWNLDTSTWFDIACEAVGRNMTVEEWEQFGPSDSDHRATCPQYGLEK